MPEAPNKKLQKFLVNLIEKPAVLKELKTDRNTVISKSKLSSIHKKILLGSNAEKIKATIAKAVTGEQSMKLKGPGSTTAGVIHIVLGSEQAKVKVSLEEKGGVLHVIHITSKVSDKL